MGRRVRMAGRKGSKPPGGGWTGGVLGEGSEWAGVGVKSGGGGGLSGGGGAW